MSPPPSKKVKAVSGDSLEEDFILEDGFAPSDAGSDDDVHPDADLSSLHSAAEDDLVEPPASGGKKRKAAADADATGKKNKAAGASGETEGKERKAKKAKKDKDGVVIESSVGLLPSASLAVTLGEKQRKALPKLSGIEMDDLRIAESMLVDTSSVAERKSLLTFIREAIPTLPSTLAKPPKKAGSPRVIVIAGAALRVADLCRELKPYKTKDIDVAKLFSKHFKLAEHVEYLNKTKVGIAVGTPGRIGKLFAESDALLLTHLSHLILDVTHLDLKNRSLLDMPEGREDLFKLVVGHKAVMDRLREGRMKLVLF